MKATEGMVTTESPEVQRLLKERSEEREEAAMFRRGLIRAPQMIRSVDEFPKVGPIPPEVEALEGKRNVSDVLETGAWEGRRCFIVAGGPSLRGFDFDSLSGELTIGINRAFEYFSPTINVAMDVDFFRWIHDGTYGDEALAKFKSYQGIKLWIDVRRAEVRDVFVIRGSRTIYGKPRLENGIYAGVHTGAGALSLAIALGADPIYLLGYDMGFSETEEGRKSHFHDGHPKRRSSDRTFEVFRRNLEAYYEHIQRWGVRVINCSPTSALGKFERGPVPGDLRDPNSVPVVVSYYTPGYEACAGRLRDSLLRHSIPMDIQAIPDAGSWESNCGRKPAFLLEMLNKHRRPVVWVDADAEVKAPLEIPKHILSGADISTRIRIRRGHKNGEVLSGTVFVNDTHRARLILNAWIREMEANPSQWDQKALAEAMRTRKGEFRFLKMARRYCYIFDEPGNEPRPVVVHYQKSREWRRAK